jgi:hypothetical protein
LDLEQRPPITGNQSGPVIWRKLAVHVSRRRRLRLGPGSNRADRHDRHVQLENAGPDCPDIHCSTAGFHILCEGTQRQLPLGASGNGARDFWC